jgi:hypothetical protein
VRSGCRSPSPRPGAIRCQRCSRAARTPAPPNRLSRSWLSSDGGRCKDIDILSTSARAPMPASSQYGSTVEDHRRRYS